MVLLIRNGHIFTPQYIGIADILIEDGTITCIRPHVTVSAFMCAREVEAEGLFITPGFIDTHMHIIGGGGELGSDSLIGPLEAGELKKNGISGCVGMLGYEKKRKTPKMLYEKAREFNRQGIETYMLSGSYHLPPAYIFSSFAEDLEDVPNCMGAGEIAICDSRVQVVQLEQLIWLLQTVHKVITKTGKPLKTVFHIGNRAKDLSLLFRMAKIYEHTVEIAIPTHVNRNETVLKDALSYIRMGGTVDVTAGISPEERELTAFMPAAEALSYIYESEGSLDGVTLSSDAGGSIPQYDQTGRITGFEKGKPSDLLADIRMAYRKGLKLSELLKTVTVNAAKAYGFSQNGIETGAKAFLNIFDDDMNLKHTVIKDIYI